MSLMHLRIATRQSPLALWQAEHVKKELQNRYPELVCELVPVTTQGDKILDTPLAAIGGKGLFIKELEQILLDNHADIAVHSMKDVTVDIPAGLDLPVILARGDMRDAFVSNHHESLAMLAENACVGTSSLRRQCQLAAMRPDLVIRTLRGNVGTRLRKLDAGEFDAILLAVAGLQRLQLDDRIREYIEPGIMVPAAGQGAIGIETRAGDTDVIDLLQSLHDQTTSCQLLAERAFSRRLYGGCQLPIAAYATIDPGSQIHLTGLVGSADGTQILRQSLSGSVENAEEIGQQLAENLLELGADKILKDILDK